MRAIRAEVKYTGAHWVSTVWFDNGDEIHHVRESADLASRAACREDSGRIPSGIGTWPQVNANRYRWVHPGSENASPVPRINLEAPRTFLAHVGACEPTQAYTAF